MLLKRLLLLFGSTAINLLVAEGVCRALPVLDNDAHVFDTPEASATSQFRMSETRGYEPIPNSGEDINNLGFRGPDVSIEKAEGTFRVLALGDSVAFGYGVPARRTFVSQLEILLNAQNPGRKFEGLNSGVSGYNTIQELALLNEVGLSLSPDLVVLGYCPNDILVTPIVFRDGDRYVFYQPNAAEPGVYNATLIRVSALYRTWLMAFELVKAKRDGTLRKHAGLKGRTENDREGSLRALREMAAVLREQKIPFICVIFPYLDQPFLDYPKNLRKVHIDARTTLEEEGVHVIDLLREWADMNHVDLKRDSSRDYVHPNWRGHLDVAERLLAWMQEKGLSR